MKNAEKNSERVKPFISFCIPSFNRSGKIHSLVNNILNYKGCDIEVLVLDNCSVDDTSEVLGSIKDTRFTYIENEYNIGGIINAFKALGFANGDYAFLCLDKDNIDQINIPELVKRLKANPDAVFGYCALNLTEQFSDILYDKGFSSVYHMAYLSRHPSGSFYKSDLYKKLPILDKIYSSKDKFGFYLDLINAEMAAFGKSLVINLPLFFTEDEKECSSTPSFTYTEHDVFFAPAKRLIEFDKYVDSSVNLRLQKRDLYKLIKKLYLKSLSVSTIGYKLTMANVAICSHYGLKKRHVTYREVLKLHTSFASFFISKDLPLSYLDKMNIVLSGFIWVMAKVLIKK